MAHKRLPQHLWRQQIEMRTPRVSEAGERDAAIGNAVEMLAIAAPNTKNLRGLYPNPAGDIAEIRCWLSCIHRLRHMPGSWVRM